MGLTSKQSKTLRRIDQRVSPRQLQTILKDPKIDRKVTKKLQRADIIRRMHPTPGF